MKFYQLTVIVLLSCICALLTAILIRIPNYKQPPTLAELRAAKTPQQKEEVAGRKPIVSAHISGGSVSIDEDPNYPISVRVK